METAPADLDADAAVALMNALVTPRPVGWISIVDATGTTNFAPYAQLVPVAPRPPLLAFVAAPGPNGAEKDTPRNARGQGAFVVNVITEADVPAVVDTAAPSDGSEFALGDAERTPAATVTPPRIAGARAHIECTTYETATIGPATLVVGAVEHVAVDNALVEDGTIDILALDTVGYLSGSHFTGLDPIDADALDD